MAEDVRFRTTDNREKERALALGFNVVEIKRKDRFKKEYVFVESTEVVKKALSQPTEPEKKTLAQLESEKEALDELITEAKKAAKEKKT